MRKWILLTVNTLLLVGCIVFSIGYSRNVRENQTEMTRDAFVSTVNAMTQVTINHLRAQQEYANNWGTYINSNNMTVQEALECLRAGNSNENVSLHLLNVDTFQGYSTTASALDAEDYTVDYSNMSADIKQRLRELAAGTDDNEYLHLTDAFSDPMTGMTVVGFTMPVTLYDDRGQELDYLLLRLVQVNDLQEQWVFPTGYEDAEIGLISNNGEYIIRSSSMKSESFLEFIRAYNNLTYPERDALEEQIESTESGVLEYMNARGEDAYWVYIGLGEDVGNWTLIGYVPVASLDSGATDWTLILFVVCVFIIIFIVDGKYFLDMNRALQKSAAAANQASEAKTRFLSSMSHDIRTPLNAITGMTTIALRHLEDQVRVRDCLEKITLSGDHLLTLINDILDISRVESGRLILSPSVFSLPEVMTNLANIVRPQVSAKRQDFNIHVVHMDYEYLYADKLRLNQIFINILSNAVKYTPEGGRITLTLEQQPVAGEDGMVRLIYTVADTGIGMTPEFIQTMFQPFTRATDDRIDKIEGSGLGLAITKQMLDAMHGTVEVESELGKGSTFRVTVKLPVTQQVSDDVMLPPMCVLVTDDDPIFLETAVDTLESLGAEADTASSGAEAVDMAVAKAQTGDGYPVIIVDWKMPGMDGIATTRAIREKVGKDVPIIILSAFDWSEIEDDALAAGASGFINKPVFRSTLYTKITELLHLDESAVQPEDKAAEGLRGMHLLLAEDNDINWEIAEELLGFHGITADRAVNGAVCVQMLEEAPAGTYQAILMDIQMPVMNGWDAARRIRKSELPHARSIPIIAMTADAFSEDVRTSLDAGMNGHIAKPIDMDLLLAELQKVRKTGKEVTP